MQLLAEVLGCITSSSMLGCTPNYGELTLPASWQYKLIVYHNIYVRIRGDGGVGIVDNPEFVTYKYIVADWVEFIDAFLNCMLWMNWCHFL